MHINGRYYKRFLNLLWSLLESHSGLLNRPSQVTATLPLSHSTSPLPTLPTAVTLPSTSHDLTSISISLPEHLEKLEITSPASSKPETCCLPDSLSPASPCEQPATQFDDKPKKSKKRGKHSKYRNTNPFQYMDLKGETED